MTTEKPGELSLFSDGKTKPRGFFLMPRGQLYRQQVLKTRHSQRGLSPPWHTRPEGLREIWGRGSSLELSAEWPQPHPCSLQVRPRRGLSARFLAGLSLQAAPGGSSRWKKPSMVALESACLCLTPALGSANGVPFGELFNVKAESNCIIT